MATHSSILVRKISWTEEPGGLQNPWGRKRAGHNLGTKPTNQYLLSIHYSPATPLGIWASSNKDKVFGFVNLLNGVGDSRQVGKKTTNNVSLESDNVSSERT